MIYDVEIGPGTIFLEHVTEQVAAAGYAGTVHSMAEGGRPGLTAGLYLAHSPWFFLLTPGPGAWSWKYSFHGLSNLCVFCPSLYNLGAQSFLTIIPFH